MRSIKQMGTGIAAIILVVLTFVVPAAANSGQPEAAALATTTVTRATIKTPAYRVPFANFESNLFQIGSEINTYQWDYVRGIKAKHALAHFSIAPVSYQKVTGAPNSKKAIAYTVKSSGNNVNDLYGLRFGGGAEIGTISKITKNGNQTNAQLKGSGICFWVDTTDYPIPLHLQFNFLEKDCDSSGAFNGQETVYRLSDHNVSVNAYLANGGSYTLETNAQHIQIPSQFQGWVMIPFSLFQQVVFDSTNTNGRIDLKQVVSITFYFPFDSKKTGRFILDEVSFYGPFFKSLSAKSLPKDTHTTAATKITAETRYEELEESSHGESSDSVGAQRSTHANKPTLGQQHPFLFSAVLVAGIAVLTGCFTYLLRKEFGTNQDHTKK